MNIEVYPPVSLKSFYEKYAKLNGRTMKVYDYQEELFLLKDNYRIVNKARQIGISTAIAMEALYYAIWYPEKTILFISTSERASRELMDKVKSLLRSMEPFNLDSDYGLATNEVDTDTKTFVQFKNGSRIISLPNNPKTIVGYKADWVYIDEFGLFENPGEIWQSILPTISRGGKITLISTPRGKLGEFYRLWDESTRGVNNFKRIEIPYQKCKEPAYIEAIEGNRNVMSEIQFKQEYECQFIDENISMFPYEILNPCVKEVDSIYNIQTVNPVYIGIDFGALRSSTVVIIAERIDTKWIIRPPIKEFVGRQITGDQKVDEDLFRPQLEYIKSLILNIRPTRVFVDSTGYGIPLFNNLRESFGGLIQGITFNNPLKENLIMHLRVMFENKQIEIPTNKILIDQLHGLEKQVTQGGYTRYSHSYGKFDDYVWALALAISPQTAAQGTFTIITRKR
jgi:phage FluMu gp28-like protein